jgi:hypothetical protein
LDLSSRKQKNKRFRERNFRIVFLQCQAHSFQNNGRAIMFAEYIRLISPGGDSPLGFGDIRQAAIIVGSGILLIFVGYKIKGMWGGIIALILGVAGFMLLKNILLL